MNEDSVSLLVERLNGDLSALVDKARTSLVRVEAGGRSVGAGTIWHTEGLILTNAHVASRRSLRVVLHDGKTYAASLLARDKKRDLAAISVKESGLPTVELGHSEKLNPGDWVVALGHPWGIEGAATAGIVISVGVPPEMANRNQRLIQVGLHLRPGHSGGPLVDARGRLVGLNIMMAGPNVGLAIPVQTIKAFLKESLADNKAEVV
jgi:S1-C subfamily serine protease